MLAGCVCAHATGAPDEVESLTAARRAAVSGSEPSDAVRVVNALLTQIDALRARENVLILTTSNITDAIDVAFVDRADIKQFIGLPSHWARYEILRSCVNELIRVGIVTATEALPAFDVLHGSESDVPADAIEGFDIDAHGADPRAAALTLSKAAFTAKVRGARACVAVHVCLCLSASRCARRRPPLNTDARGTPLLPLLLCCNMRRA